MFRLVSTPTGILYTSIPVCIPDVGDEVRVFNKVDIHNHYAILQSAAV